MSKYVTVKIGTVITSISETTDIPGYTIGVIEIFFPDEDVIKKWSKKEEKIWTETNNNRMIAICKFLNENNL